MGKKKGSIGCYANTAFSLGLLSMVYSIMPLRRSVSIGIILFTSPTIPTSATLNIGANLSLLIATIKSLSSIPARCWIAPLIPHAI